MDRVGLGRRGHGNSQKTIDPEWGRETVLTGFSEKMGSITARAMCRAMAR